MVSSVLALMSIQTQSCFLGSCTYWYCWLQMIPRDFYDSEMVIKQKGSSKCPKSLYR